MAEENKTETTDATEAEVVEPSKKGGNMLLMILIPVMLVVGVGGGFLASTLFSHKKEEAPKKDEKENEELSEEDQKKKETIDPEHMIFVTVPDVLVNLKSSKQRPVFLKASIVLEVHDPKLKETIENLRPKMVDQLQIFLRDLETADVTGSSNLQRLRQELLVRINNVTSPYKVQDVLIKDFLVQ